MLNHVYLIKKLYTVTVQKYHFYDTFDITKVLRMKLVIFELVVNVFILYLLQFPLQMDKIKFMY